MTCLCNAAIKPLYLDGQIKLQRIPRSCPHPCMLILIRGMTKATFMEACHNLTVVNNLPNMLRILGRWGREVTRLLSPQISQRITTYPCVPTHMQNCQSFILH